MTISQTHHTPDEWLTHAEKTDYRETPRYDATIAYAKRLDAASQLIKFETFGKSGEGRELPLLIAAENDAFTPDAARRAHKPVILIQGCIHAGEPDGKDAGLALLRDIAITKTREGLLKNVVVLFIPIYNTDGHERVSPYNRINQNGPEEMGWRTTTSYQNLNRDYMKADTPETRAWLSLWNRWAPDLFIDCHVTNGADYQYNITYQHEHHAGVPASVLDWERKVVDGRVATATEAAGNVVSWYLEFVDNRDFSKGIRDFNGSPRFSTGYLPLRNRPGILIETHMLKPYRPRVIGTYDFLRFTLEEVNKDPEALFKAGRDADAEAEMLGSTYDPQRKYPIEFELTEKTVPFKFRGLESKVELSEISNTPYVSFGTKPMEMTVPMYNDLRIKTAVAPPLYYIVPPQWTEVIDVIKAHGLKTSSTKAATQIEIESYRFREVKWAPAPFEGRQMPSFKVEVIREQRTFPAGSLVIQVAQRLSRVAINLLEPEAPDSLVRWGFFNATFEQKEYGEAYVVEKLAREMLAKDPKLREEFEKRLATDPAFAANSYERLQFFYRRSPYWDPQMNLYPVGRIISNVRLPL
ncbi:MAG TPA: M14 family metallopeptidase [Pyrinomonadaceae bacterium]|nr:M14 family metallopeptidase [Pyrinomonadaceae bacterium]